MKTHCALCEGNIQGRKLRGSKTAKSTSRIFSGLCGACVRGVVTESVRVKEGFKNLESVDIDYRSYVSKLLK